MKSLRRDAQRNDNCPAGLWPVALKALSYS